MLTLVKGAGLKDLMHLFAPLGKPHCQASFFNLDLGRLKTALDKKESSGFLAVMRFCFL